MDTESITDACACGALHQLCPGCREPRCYACIPYGTADDCDRSGLPGGDIDETRLET